MKIKIIDLLAKIANGEQVPEKIKYNNKIWEYYVYADDYKGENIWLFEELFKYRRTIKFINDEVEIIEKSKKIEKLDYKYVNTYGNVSQHRKSEEPLIDKINELIDEINNLKEND